MGKRGKYTRWHWQDDEQLFREMKAAGLTETWNYEIAGELSQHLFDSFPKRSLDALRSRMRYLLQNFQVCNQSSTENRFHHYYKRHSEEQVAKCIYILRCKHSKWYIGSTGNISRRFQQHIAGYGSEWTRQHPPIEVYHKIPLCDPQDATLRPLFDPTEDGVTIKMMMQYGIENVRGGSFTQSVLPDEEVAVIRKIIATNSSACFKCGSTTHFQRECIIKSKKI